MNEIPIPRRFTIFGRTFEVQDDPALAHHEDCIGQARYRDNKILLQTDCVAYPMARSKREQVFFHELIHACLNSLCYTKKNDDEAFVDRLASALHQALATAEYEEDSGGEDA